MSGGAKSSAHPFLQTGAPICRQNSKPAWENSRSRLTSCGTDAPLVRANLRSKALKRTLRLVRRKGCRTSPGAISPAFTPHGEISVARAREAAEATTYYHCGNHVCTAPTAINIGQLRIFIF